MKVGKITVEYIQTPDDYDENQDSSMQTLTLTAQPALLHLYEQGKNDFYIVLETERFAFESSNELIDILKDFEKRIFEQQLENKK